MQNVEICYFDIFFKEKCYVRPTYVTSISAKRSSIFEFIAISR